MFLLFNTAYAGGLNYLIVKGYLKSYDKDFVEILTKNGKVIKVNREFVLSKYKLAPNREIEAYLPRKIEVKK
jgi:hypothetical protein